MQPLPYNETFEKALLVGILSDPTLLPQVNQLVSEEDFFKFSHKEIFKTMNSISIDDIDSLVIQDKLSEDSKEHFSDLIREGDSIIPSLSNILVYAEEIRGKSLLRQCIKMGQDIAAIGWRPNIGAEEALAELERQFAEFIYKRVQTSSDISTKQAFESFIENLGTRVNREGIRTGFFAIDMVLHHLEGLVILAAKTSMGKTAMAINIARNVAEHKPVLIFSLEQSQEQVFERMLSSESEVNLEDIRTGAFVGDKESADKIKAASLKLLPVFNHVHVDERAALSASHISSTARQKKIEWGEIGIIVVDYLHIMSLNDKMTVESLGDAVKDLRALGKELGCPVLLLSQLSRQPETVDKGEEKKARRRPQLSDLRSSGEIEQSADIVMFLYRDSYYSDYKPEDDSVEVIIAKNRNGRSGTVMIDWWPRYVKFTDQR